jgi:hypothetical protein
MSKNKNKNNKNKNNEKTMNKLAVARPVKSNNGYHEYLAHQTCAVIDPFCPAARTARWFSTGANATLTYQIRYHVTLTTGATGNAGLVFVPSINGYTSISVGTDTVDLLTKFPNTGSLPWISTIGTGSVTNARVVSSGMHWWDVAPTTSAGGTTVVNTFNDAKTMETTGVFNTMTIGLNNETFYKDRRKEGYWISRPNETDSYEFNAPFGGAPANYQSNNMNMRSCAILGVTGAANTAVLECVFVTNCEIQISPNEIFSQTASRVNQVQLDHKVEEIADVVYEKLDPASSGKPESLFGKIKRISTNFLKSSVRDIAYYGAKGVADSYMAGAKLTRNGFHAIMDVD